MKGAIQSINDDASLYDYCGRMPLQTFLALTSEKIAAHHATQKERHSHEKAWRKASLVTGPGSLATPPAVLRPRLAPAVAVASPLKSPQGGRRGLPQASHPALISDAVPAPVTHRITQAGKKEFMFGAVWQTGTAAVHRMSSKKLIIASMTPVAAAASAPSAVNGITLAPGVQPPPGQPSSASASPAGIGAV